MLRINKAKAEQFGRDAQESHTSHRWTRQVPQGYHVDTSAARSQQLIKFLQENKGEGNKHTRKRGSYSGHFELNMPCGAKQKR